MTKYPQRKSPRLQGYDYQSAGAYFITICTHQRWHHFGRIINATMHTSTLGHIAEEIWHTIPQVFPSVHPRNFVVMPNHVHGILYLGDDPAHRPALGNVINNYKGTVTRTAKRRLDAPPLPLWQSRYHDHIIRDINDLHRIQEYISQNVARWHKDVFHDTLS